jgi:hypothetical protein
MDIDPAELALIVVNLLAGLGSAIPLAGMLARTSGRTMEVSRCYAILVGVYLVECAAVVMGMGIPVFSIGLALVWGIVLGRWLRRLAAETREAARISLYLSLYSSLPAASFIIVPVAAWLGGHAILSVDAGSRFGIPSFIPWPMNTILGFYAACALGALLFKTVVTTGEALWLIHRGLRKAESARGRA